MTYSEFYLLNQRMLALYLDYSQCGECFQDEADRGKLLSEIDRLHHWFARQEMIYESMRSLRPEGKWYQAFTVKRGKESNVFTKLK